MKNIKHKTSVITPNRISSKAIGNYGYYDLGKTIQITYISIWKKEY